MFPQNLPTKLPLRYALSMSLTFLDEKSCDFFEYSKYRECSNNMFFIPNNREMINIIKKQSYYEIPLHVPISDMFRSVEGRIPKRESIEVIRYVSRHMVLGWEYFSLMERYLSKIDLTFEQKDHSIVMRKYYKTYTIWLLMNQTNKIDFDELLSFQMDSLLARIEKLGG